MHETSTATINSGIFALLVEYLGPFLQIAASRGLLVAFKQMTPHQFHVHVLYMYFLNIYLLGRRESFVTMHKQSRT